MDPGRATLQDAGAKGDTPHIAVTPWEFSPDGMGEGLAAQGALAEELGFHSFWLPENHFTGRSSIPAPLLLLAAVAARTERIRLGTTSYLLPIRHPIHAASEVAVLDRVSGGRVILGVGRGFQRAMFDTYGVESSRKRELFEAALERMIAAWQGKPLSPNHDSEVGDDVLLDPLPVQKPHPPIWIAAFGPKAIRQAGRLALPYLASPMETLPRLVANYESYREAAEEAGREVPAHVPVMRTVFVSRNASALAQARETLAAQARALAKSPTQSFRRAASENLEDWALVGEPAEVADGIARYREALGITHLVATLRTTGVGANRTRASLEELSAFAK
ncbi:MAG: LLM class flavin-dependent oxidoreductase [Myxococcales bacterium]|nr:LLM class flavin-dependent oxidoreductase [Myxococcales bacterium]